MSIIDQALLVRLLIAHFASDFLLQSSSMIKAKRARSWKAGALYLHASVYAAVVFLAASHWHQWFWLLPALFLSHVLFDGWKSSRRDRIPVFLADQFGHLVVIGAIFIALTEHGTGRLSWALRELWLSPRALTIILGYLAVLWPAGHLVQTLTSQFRRQLADDKARGLELAGLWIGCLERAFLVTFILLDFLSGAALLLGMKSLFRFGEIKDPANRKETEYILIGTLLSFAVAVAIGVAVKQALRSLP